MTTAANHLQLVRSLASDHEVFGELGRRDNGDVWYLARKTDDPALVAIRLTTRGADEWGDAIHDIEVVREVGSDVSVSASACRDCGSPLRTFARFCGQCGADQTAGLQTGTNAEEHRELLARVREAAEAVYDVLGEMPRAEGGGMVYFARRRDDATLVQLRLRISGDDMELGETHVGDVIHGAVTVTPIRPSIRVSGPRERPSAAKVEPPVPPRPSVRLVSASPERSSQERAPAGAPPERTSLERRLMIAVLVLSAVVIVETIYLVLR